MKVTRFEDLEIWKEARELCKLVCELTTSGPFIHDFKFRDQIRASSGSAMDNIAEGFERGGNKEFVQFLWVSKGSTGEVRSQSYRAYDVKYINEEMFNELLKRTDSISRKTFNLIQHLRDSDIKGIKYF
jgi:four helix bundle protein